MPTGPGQSQLPLQEEASYCFLGQVRQNSLFVSKTTYSNQGDALPGSVLDFDVDPATGQVLGVKVSEVRNTKSCWATWAL